MNLNKILTCGKYLGHNTEAQEKFQTTVKKILAPGIAPDALSEKIAEIQAIFKEQKLDSAEAVKNIRTALDIEKCAAQAATNKAARLNRRIKSPGAIAF